MQDKPITDRTSTTPNEVRGQGIERYAEIEEHLQDLERACYAMRLIIHSLRNL
jgi:hypothetical protein